MCAYDKASKVFCSIYNFLNNICSKDFANLESSSCEKSLRKKRNQQLQNPIKFATNISSFSVNNVPKHNI